MLGLSQTLSITVHPSPFSQEAIKKQWQGRRVVMQLCLFSFPFAPLPELSFGGSATVTEILAFPLGLKKKKERKKRGPACRGRKKPLCQTTQSSSHA